MKRIFSMLLALVLLATVFVGINDTALASSATGTDSHTHNWKDIGRTMQPTCTQYGYRTEMCTICQQDRQVPISPLGHYFPNPWVTITAPTCTTVGHEMNTCVRVNRGTECGYEWWREIPALGHDWGEATYVWAEDNSSVTANRVCARVESHVATETAKAAGKVTKEATCEAPGETTYTATFENAAFETQTKTEKNIPAKGHAWGKPAWSWTEDNKASAAFTCANDAEHVKTVEAEVEEVRKTATCTEDGSATYTAKVTFEGKEYTDTQVKTLTATGHSWGKATYVWAEDNGSVTAKRVCANDETHIETETAKATAEITKGADCEESGEITYTAVFENAAFEKQTKTEATSPMGHAWGDWKTVKEPTADADGEEQRVCDRCGAEQTRALPYGGHVCPSAHFTDTDLGLWYHEDLDYVVENGLMIGMSADEFGPDLVMTRAMVVTALYRLEGEPTPKSSVSAFGDVVRGSWYAAAVNWAAENGIVKGMSAEEFMPNDSITREQMATIFYRYAKYKGYNVAASDGLNKFTDAGKVSGWALEAMQWCVGAGLINGMSKTELSPRGTATRIQYAAILHRFCVKVRG